MTNRRFEQSFSQPKQDYEHCPIEDESSSDKDKINNRKDRVKTTETIFFY